MSEPPSDVVGADGDTGVCPVCDATTIEKTIDGDLDYRCLDCGAEFDSTGGRINVE